MARNREIVEAKNKSRDASTLEKEIAQVHDKWMSRLKICAQTPQSQHHNSPHCRYPESDDYLPEDVRAEPLVLVEKYHGPTLPIIIAIVVASLFVGGCGVALLAYVLIRRRSKPNTQIGPISGDANVVVGRPVPANSASAQAADAGVPVATVPAKGVDPTEPAKPTAASTASTAAPQCA